jgi:two-component system, OmpR family, phosphate regulon sensor histidine kinase PhoR
MARLRDRLRLVALLPAVVIAVGVLAFFTLRSMLQIDKLRQQSVLEATLALATEKANRLDRQIIDQDNVVIAIADPASLTELTERWIPTAQRETPTIRAILILDDSRSVLAFASRAIGPWMEEEAFRRLLTQQIVGDMDTDVQRDELRHLHREYGGQSYLLSYWQREHEGRRYLVVAWHDIGRIVRETLATLYVEAQPSGARVNVVDEEGRIIYGPPLRSGELTVGVRFPTTLYNWRLQVSPLSGEELASKVQNRRLLEITVITLSCAVIVAGAIVMLLLSEKERRISTLKSEFVANVSHELKTPLALVRMFAEMLQSGRVPTEAKRREYLDVIVRESERLTALIENVLDFAKLERGRGAFELAPGDVGDAVARATNAYRYRAEREGVSLEVDVDEDLPEAHIDDRAIQLAVSNLLDNALKYAPGGERVGVCVRHWDDGIRVDVTDEGPGVPAEDARRIFERFVRGPVAEAPSKAPVRGSGIGLALVKHIAESHGGKAWVEPRGDLPGSTFSFTVPQAGRIGRGDAPEKPTDAT